jgi:glycosyltransferase involved in cell wall biosynthesis
MRAAGHTVCLLAARGEAPAPDLPLRRLPLADSRHPDVLAVKAELDAGRMPAGFQPLAARILAELRPALADVDLLIAHNVCSLNKNLALTAALQRLAGEPGAPSLILWHHDLAWTTPRYQAELHPGYPWDLLRTDWGARHVTVSELRRRELAGLFGIPAARITVVPNGVQPDDWLKLESQTRRLAAAMGLAGAGPRLLLPVRLTPRKNIELALETLAILRRRWPRAALIVTGPEGAHNPANAGYRRRLLDLRDALDLGQAAHFAAEYTAGLLPDAVVADFFRLSDALFLPSREEGFGLPLIEAALARLPVFCAAIDPLPELGGPDVHYFELDAGPEKVADLIYDQLSADPVFRFAVRARTAYAWERVYDQFIEPLLSPAGPR